VTKKIVAIKGKSFRCACGCGITYDRQGFVDHYQADVLPDSLAQYAGTADESDLLRDVADPRNHKIL